MKSRTIGVSLLAAAVIGSSALLPAAVGAQSWRQHRQNMQNQWRDIAIGSGALGVLGLLKHDNTLTFAGGAGALYSLYRYEQDKNSSNAQARARAAYFHRRYFYRDGVRYDRRTVRRNGHEYYQFVRH